MSYFCHNSAKDFFHGKLNLNLLISSFVEFLLANKFKQIQEAKQPSTLNIKVPSNVHKIATG